jgi:putative oxidoreductase
MIVAIAMAHRQFGLLMNWTGAQKGEGFEYHLLVLAITIFLMIRGAGAVSLTGCCHRWQGRQPACKSPDSNL